MTQQPQQFKFGDRVRCKQTGAAGLLIATGNAAAWIIWQGQKCSNFYAYDTFEPIPHPDTSRLDWLFEKDHQLRSRWCKDEHDNLRDAIDAAMKETN